MAIQVNSSRNKTYAFSGSMNIDKSSPLWSTAQTQVVNFLQEVKRENGQVIVGDAVGIDALVAAEATRLGIPVLTLGTGQVPRIENQNQFGELTKGFGETPLTRAFEPFPALPKEAHKESYSRRDEEMVNRADVVIGIWDGHSTGTKIALDRARTSGKQTFLLDLNGGQVITSDNQSRPMGVFWAEQMNTAKSNRAITRDIWEKVTAEPGFNLFGEHRESMEPLARFQTTIERMDAAVARINDSFRFPFQDDNDSLPTRAVSGLRDIAFNQKYDPAWNSIGGFTDPLKSGQQLKWRGGSGSFSDMLASAQAAAEKQGSKLAYQVRSDNYGEYLETVLETRNGSNRFYQKIRYNAQENVWISNSGSSNERVHTSRFTKDNGGAIAYQDIGYSLWDTLTNTKDSDFIKGFMLTSRDRVQTFLERKERMILGASLAEDMQPDNLFDINRAHDSMITGARKAMEDGGFPVGELVFQKGKANSSNPPSLMDLSRRIAGTSAATEKDYVRRTRDNALGYISYHGEVPELEWRSKVLFGNEVPMTGTISRVASVFNPLFFGEGMGYTLGRPQLVEMQEVPLAPESPARRYNDFSQIGFMEVNQTLTPRDMRERFGLKGHKQDTFLFGFMNRGINDVVSSTSMLFARFYDATNMEAKPAAYSKNQMVGMSRGTSLARAGQSVSGDRELNMITMSPIKPVRFLDETMDVWRSNAKDPISDMISAAVAAGKYKTEAEAKTAFYEDSQRGEITLVPSPDGSSYIPRFSRDSKWQAYAGVAALAWRYGQIETVTTNGPVQANSIDAIFKKINELNKTNISYERILKGEISYEELPFTAKNDLSKYGIKGWSSSLTQGVRFRIESAMDVSDRVMRGQRVKPNSSWNLTELDIDVLEAQQPEVATLFKNMYGANNENKVRKFHAQRLGAHLNVRDKNSDDYVHFVKAGGVELDLSDSETLKYLNNLVALTRTKTASLVDMMGEKAPSKKNRSYNEMLDKKDGYQYEAYDISFGPEFVRALKEALGTDIIAIHSGNGMSSVIDLSALSGKKYEANPLAIAITTGNVDHNALSGIANRQLPEGVSKVGSVKVAGIATRAASAKVPPGVVVVYSRMVKQTINNMPISIDEKLRMMSDLDRGIPLEGIVRVQNFDRLAGSENQAVYAYEEAVKLWPEIKGDPVSSAVPVRVNALLLMAGSRDMDGDNLQLAFTSRRHVTAKEHWTDRQLGTPYPEGMLDQSVGGEFADMEKKALGLNSDLAWQGHMTNLQMLRDANNPEKIGKVMEQVEKLLKESKKAGDSLREKYYANILMGYSYTTGTVVMAGMAQGDVQSGRNRYSPEQRFSMMHMPTEWYQESMDLKAITNMGVLSILNTRNDAKLDKDGNWLKPVDLMTDDEYNNYSSELSSWKNAIKRNLKAGKRPHPGNVSEKELSDFLLREFLQVSGLEADDPKAKEYSKLLNKKYQSQIGESSFSKELAYMMLPNGTEAGDFDKLADLISQNKQDEAFSMIKLLHGDTEWLRGNSPMANYSLNMTTASRALLMGKDSGELASMSDEEFSVFASLLSRKIKKGQGRDFGNSFYQQVLRRAESLDEYRDTAFAQTIRSLSITDEDRSAARSNPYSIENLKKWVDEDKGEGNAYERTIKYLVKMLSGFAGGGFTGYGGKFEPAGLVHKGEYVLTKEQVEHIKAGGGDSVMAEVARNLGGGASAWSKDSFFAGGFFGSFASTLTDNLTLGKLSRNPQSAAYGSGNVPNVHELNQVADAYSIPGRDSDFITIGQTFKDSTGRDQLVQRRMSFGEFKRQQSMIGYAKSGEILQGQAYLEQASAASANWADFSKVTREEAMSREWDPTGDAINSRLRLRPAPGVGTRLVTPTYASRRTGAHLSNYGTGMSQADWAFGTVSAFSEAMGSAEEWNNLTQGEQIAVREALGVISNIREGTELSVQNSGGGLGYAASSFKGLGFVDDINGGTVSRLEVFGAVQQRARQLGITGLSQAGAYEAAQSASAKISRESGLSVSAVQESASGLKAMNEHLGTMAQLLPKVNEGHQMFVKQAQAAVEVFSRAQTQLAGLETKMKENLGLNAEDQKMWDDLHDPAKGPSGKSVADYISANAGTVGALGGAVQDRMFRDMFKQPFADMTASEKSDQLMQALLGASSKSGQKRLENLRAMGLGDEGLEVAGMTIRGEGAQNAYGKFARGFNAVNNASTIWAMRSISSMIVNPALESAADYEKTSASMGRSMYGAGLMSYDELMSSKFGTMINRQARREAGQFAYGQAVYGAYAPLMDMFMSPEMAKGPIGLATAIGVPAVGAGLLGQSVLAKMGMGMVGGLPVGALIAGGAALYGVGATMGEAATDVTSMGQNNLYGQLGRFGSTIKQGLYEMGLPFAADWGNSQAVANASPTVNALAGMVATSQISSEAVSSGFIFGAGTRNELENLYGSSLFHTTTSPASQVDQIQVQAAAMRANGASDFEIQGYLETQMADLLEGNVLVSQTTQNILGISTPPTPSQLAQRLMDNQLTVSESGVSRADQNLSLATAWAETNHIPFTSDVKQQTIALYSALSMYGQEGNQDLVDNFASMIGTGIDANKVISQITSAFAPTDTGSINQAFDVQSDEYNALIALGFPEDIAISSSTNTASSWGNMAMAERRYGNVNGLRFFDSDFSMMAERGGTEFANRAGDMYFGNLSRRGVSGGQVTNEFAETYLEAYRDVDLTQISLMDATPLFYGASRRGGSMTSLAPGKRQSIMEGVWQQYAGIYGAEDAGLASASRSYGLISSDGLSDQQYKEALEDFTLSVIGATDSMVDWEGSFQNWMTTMGKSFTNATEAQALMTEWQQATGFTMGTTGTAEEFTGVPGALRAAYSRMTRTSTSMPALDFTNARDEDVGRAILGLANTSYAMSARSPSTQAMMAGQLGVFSDLIQANPNATAMYSQQFMQGANALQRLDNSTAFGYAPSLDDQIRTFGEASLMTPAQDRVVQAAQGGSQLAQSLLLGSSPRFSAMTAYVGSTSNSALYGLPRYQYGFQQTVGNVPGDANRIAAVASQLGMTGNQWLPGGTSESNIQSIMDQFPQGIVGIQNAIAWTNYQAQAAQYSYSTLGRRIDRALTQGGSSLDPQTGFAIGGSNAGAAPLFKRLGMDFMPGNGMTYWQIEDAQVGIQRERQQFGLQQQGQSLAISQDQFALTGRQFNEREAMSYRRLAMSDRQFQESLGLRRERFEYNVGYQQREMTIGRGIQMAQEGWRGEDLAYNRNMMEVQFGFQMRDANRNIRYARGRDRIDLMRQRDDATVLYSMQAGQADRQEGRHKTEMQWSAEEFKRREENFKKETAFSRQEMALQEKQHAEQMKFSQDELKLQRKHFEEGRELDKKRLDMQQEAYAKEIGWMSEVWALEDQRRLLDRQHYIEQAILQQKMADAAMGAATKVFGLNLMLGLLSIASGVLHGTMNTMAFTDMPEINDQLREGVDQLRLAANILANMFMPATPTMTGGYIGPEGVVPQFADGGYTGDGLIAQSKGLIEVHGGEYVIPNRGTPVVRGDNPATLALLAEIRDELKRIREMGPGRVNATITTNQSKISTGDLIDAAYATRR